MASPTMHCTYRTLLNGVFANSISRSSSLPPSFLLPAFAATQSTSNFSTTSASQARKDGNPRRGVSPLRRTGLKGLKISKSMLDTLPQPVLDQSRHSVVEVDEDHGLWEFFPPDRKAMATPAELGAHGRSWTVAELRNKDWDDLHRLWWVCLKELNRLHTSANERARIGNMYGDYESDARKLEVKRTMKAIKHTLTERWYAWDNARHAAMEDDEISMYADLDAGEPAYLPKDQDEFEAKEQSSGARNSSQGDGSLPPPANQASAGEARP